MRVVRLFAQVIGNNDKATPAAASTANRGLTHPLATNETGGLDAMVSASESPSKTPRGPVA